MSKKSEEEPRTRIWTQPLTVEMLNALGKGSMVEHLGITFTDVGPDALTASMPVDARTRQPYGLLHGGASVALAETLGSVGATFCVDPERQHCVGIEINANHMRAVRSGRVTGTARPLHLGRRTQVWEVHIRDEQERLVSVSRLTLAVVAREESGAS